MTETAKKGLLRVNFSLRGFAKIINQQTLTPFTPDPVALESFGRYLASLDLAPDNPLTFASIADFRGIDYVGYVVEKERLDPLTGTWVRLEEYRIIGAKACSYKDTRVAYGQVYRYRIRTVVKFTSANVQHVNLYPIFQDMTTVLKQALNSSAVANAPLIQRLAPAGLQSQANSLTQRVVNLTDNLNISVDSNGVPKFNFTVPTPAAQATNSKAVTSLQSLQAALASSKSITNEVLQSHINTLQSFAAPTNTAPANTTYSSEYLVSYPSRNWQYVTTVNNNLPAWPETIQVVPSTPTSSITVYWLPPPDTQLDLASFNVYRRNVVGDAWVMVAQNVPAVATKDNPNACIYIDTDVAIGNQYIYAVQTNNVHGYQGFLSSQVQAELNSSFTFEQKEKDLKWISGPGARPDEPNTIFEAFYDANEQLIAYKNVVISPSTTFNDTDATIVLKVRSLDTQEKKDFVVRLHNKSTT